MIEHRAIESPRQLVDQGWTYHDTQSERLARELEAAAGTNLDTDLVAPFMHLSTHTIGEHLGDWARALELGQRVLAGRIPGVESAQAWARLHVAAVLAENPVAAAELERAYLTAAGGAVEAAGLELRFLLIGALVGSKRVDEAARLYGAAVASIERRHASESLQRTVATVSNNLGWELYESGSRTADLDGVMRLCADTSLTFWLLCGNWINEQRARYLRALVSNALGNPESALADAHRALSVIAMHAPRPHDAALLHLARASALAALGDDRGRSRAIAEADAAASDLTAPDLKAQFAVARAKLVAPA